MDKKTPLDQNLVTLNGFKATATMTKPGEVRLILVENTHLAYEVICYTVHNARYGFPGIKQRVRPIIMMNAANSLPHAPTEQLSSS